MIPARTLGILALALLAGCNTVKRGTKEDVAIDVTPKSATIATTLGATCVGPCVLTVPRRQKFSVTASAPGYRSETVDVAVKFGEEGKKNLAGHIILPGGLAMTGVDLASGAALDHVPNPVVIKLKKAGPGIDPRRRRQGVPVS